MSPMGNGLDVQAGDIITFVPGGNPIYVGKLGVEKFTHPTLGLEYRLFEDTRIGFGYVLFDTQLTYIIERTERAA